MNWLRKGLAFTSSSDLRFLRVFKAGAQRENWILAASRSWPRHPSERNPPEIRVLFPATKAGGFTLKRARLLPRTDFVCIFRRLSDTHSDSYRTVIPIQSGHLFRLISDSDSDSISDTFPVRRHGVRYHRKGVRLASARCLKWSELIRSGATQDKPPEAWLLRFEPIVAGIIMAREPLSMRQIKELLRLKHEHGLSVREIARSCGLPVSTVGDYLKRAQSAGLNWPLPEELTEEQLLDKLLDSTTQAVADPPARALPNWKEIHQELRRKSVTLQLLWNEYHQIHPEGYAYSRFCELY